MYLFAMGRFQVPSITVQRSTLNLSVCISAQFVYRPKLHLPMLSQRPPMYLFKTRLLSSKALGDGFNILMQLNVEVYSYDRMFVYYDVTNESEVPPLTRYLTTTRLFPVPPTSVSLQWTLRTNQKDLRLTILCINEKPLRMAVKREFVSTHSGL